MDFSLFMADRDADLSAYLSTFNVYDLERLKSCFEYEYSTRKDSKGDIKHIIDTIDEVLQKRYAEQNV